MNKNLFARIEHGRIKYPVSKPNQDLLSGAGYIPCVTEPGRGIVVNDGNSAAQPTSDYRRNFTTTTVIGVMNMVRGVAKIYFGNKMTATNKIAFENDVKTGLMHIQNIKGAIERFNECIRQTKEDQVIGNLRLDLDLYPAEEFRKISLSITLSAAVEETT